MLNSNVAPYVSLFIWRLLNSPDVIEMPKGPISKWLFASGNIFVPAISVTLDTQAFPNINKENLAFLSWNPMSQVHFLCANKYPEFTNRNLKPALQLSRLYQGHCHPRTPIRQDIWLPPMDSWASGRKHWVSNWQLMPPSDSSSEWFWSNGLCMVVEREHCVLKASTRRHDDQLRAWFGVDFLIYTVTDILAWLTGVIRFTSIGMMWRHQTTPSAAQS